MNAPQSVLPAPTAASPADPDLPGKPHRRRIQVIALVVVLALGYLVVHNVIARASAAGASTMPANTAMEDALGVRFSRVAVVGDGGLVQVSYVILDTDKATRFQDDRANLPILTNVDTDAATRRVALMKQGHSLPVGQTFYFVYNNNGTVHPGDLAALASQGMTLSGIRVQ